MGPQSLAGAWTSWVVPTCSGVASASRAALAARRPSYRMSKRPSIVRSVKLVGGVRLDDCNSAFLTPDGVPTRSHVIDRPPQRLRLVETVGNGQSIGPAGSHCAKAGSSVLPVSRCTRRPYQVRNSERQIELATWASAIAAFMSVLATIGLVYLAFRQEKATYDSVLITTQVQSVGEYVKDFNLAFSKGALGTDRLVGLGKLKEQILDYRRLINKLLSSSEALSMLSPDEIVQRLDAVAGMMQDVDSKTILQNISNETDDELALTITHDLDNALTAEKEVTKCYRTLLRLGRVVNQNNIKVCDLAKGTQSR